MHKFAHLELLVIVVNEEEDQNYIGRKTLCSGSSK